MSIEYVIVLLVLGPVVLWAAVRIVSAAHYDAKLLYMRRLIGSRAHPRTDATDATDEE